jgi:hypothetical protein
LVLLGDERQPLYSFGRKREKEKKK